VVIPWGISFGWGYCIASFDIDNALLYILPSFNRGLRYYGWASNNKFSLMGAVRAASQMVSYEVAMGLSIALLMMTGTEFERNCSATIRNALNVFYQPFPFIFFNLCICRNK
jgi:NADH-quinone oxidoreductase subunit H